MKKNNPPPFPLPSRYKFANKTLQGGQGAVYVCEDKFLSRKVAVKTLHAAGHGNALIKEIGARAKIKSKHVAEIYECLSDAAGKPVALVLEYVPGESLDDKSLHPVDIAGKLLLLYQVACGIADMHEAKVIHRDIKPQNMKVDGEGVLKIFDLGIANIDADNASTLAGAGTLIFRAPELYNTLPAGVTTAADVYALGVMAWYLLSASFPKALLENPPQSSGMLVPQISSMVSNLGSCGAIIDRCLDINPKSRPQAAMLREAVASRINFGKRRGMLNYKGKVYEVKNPNTSTIFKIPSLGEIRIHYDGERFRVSEFSGSVYINNKLAVVGMDIPDSCVLTFGDTSLGGSRKFVTFNVSQPGIVL